MKTALIMGRKEVQTGVKKANSEASAVYHVSHALIPREVAAVLLSDLLITNAISY